MSWPRQGASLRWALVAASASAWSACSWDRFDELREATPVLTLQAPPDQTSDFGATLAGLAAGDRTSVLVGGLPKTAGAAAYLLGQEEEARASAAEGDYCPSSNASRMCFLATRPASLLSAMAPNERAHANCYVSGVGRSVSDVGLWTRCEDTAEFALPVPPDVLADLVEPALSGGQIHDVVLASQPEIESALVVGVSALARAFFYEPASFTPVDLVPTGGGVESLGSAVAVLGVGNGARVFAIGAPSRSEVHFFLADGGSPVHLGCWSGLEAFGRTMATGDYDDDGVTDLAVSDQTAVTVVSGRALSELDPAASSECEVSGDALTLAQLECEEYGEAEDCAESRFGAALGIADFDGDGSMEVAVGAPRMTVRGLEDAGAVLIYDQDSEVVDARFVSTQASGDHFGAALVTVPQVDRDILVVAAPGAASAHVVYCATIAGTGKSPRCLE